MSDHQKNLNVEAWRRACELYHKAEAGAISENDFLCDFADLMVLYGDPTKETPKGVIDVQILGGPSQGG